MIRILCNIESCTLVHNGSARESRPLQAPFSLTSFGNQYTPDHLQQQRVDTTHIPLDVYSVATVFESVPIPDISTSTTSPGCMGPMPAGVPVMITSSGNKVMI